MHSGQSAHPAQLHQNDTPVGIPLVDHVQHIEYHPDHVVFIVDPDYAPQPLPLSRVIWSNEHGCWFAVWPNGEIHGGQHHDYAAAVDHAHRLDAEIRGENAAYSRWLDEHFGEEG